MLVVQGGRRALYVGLAALVLLLSGCSGNENGTGSGAGGGSLSTYNLAGAKFRVGSKEFTEQLVLSQITIQALRATGADTEDRSSIQGTTNVRRALTSNELDMYWDYTGTGWTTLLGHTPAEAPRDGTALYEAVAREDLQRNQVKWLTPAPLNDTYALATSRATAQRLNVRTISDYARLANSTPEQASLCAASEFLTRDDGWPGVQKAYGFGLPANLVRTVDLGVIYARIPKAQECNFGEVTSTDGRILANDLVVLEDDKRFFVLYNGALTIRNDVYSRYPQLQQIFAPISAKLTSEVLRGLNERVDVKGELPEEVAKSFLRENGFIS